MTGSGLICRITTSPHPDPKYTKIQVGNIYGELVIISKDIENNSLGVYFDSECQLSEPFASANKLFKTQGGYLEPNGRVRTLKLGGVKSMGIWLPLSSLEKFGNATYKEGQRILVVKGVEISRRYVSPAQQRQMQKDKAAYKKLSFIGKVKRFFTRNKTNLKARQFPQHYDTTKFGVVLNHATLPTYYIITEKLHGTSARQGRLLLSSNGLSPFQKLVNRFFPFFKESKDWFDVYGTRRVNMQKKKIGEAFELKKSKEDYRAYFANRFKERLYKGEVIFYELVGYDSSGGKIMPAHDPKKISKEFAEQYKSMEYTYGNSPGSCEAYLYRIAFVNEDGQLFEMPWSYVARRAKEIGMKLVPVLRDGVLDEVEGIKEAFLKVVDQLSEGKSTLSASHIKEGVCVRFENIDAISVGKYKSWEFVTMENQAKDNKDYIDVEEAESVENEDEET